MSEKTSEKSEKTLAKVNYQPAVIPDRAQVVAPGLYATDATPLSIGVESFEDEGGRGVIISGVPEQMTDPATGKALLWVHDPVAFSSRDIKRRVSALLFPRNKRR